MSRQVRGDLPSGVKINETGLKILALVDRHTKGRSGGVPLSLERMGASVGVSETTARRNCRVLEQQGLLVVSQRYRSDGGRLENEYAVTDKGRAVLAGVKRM